MVKSEKAFKWGIAIIVIFGLLNAFYFLNWIIALKVALPILCVFMIGAILLQSGKGGGLAAIGGLGDQAAFGTRTSSFLTQVTYLIGAAFIVTTILLFKLSVPTEKLESMITQEMPAGRHASEHDEHAGHDHGEHEGHDHGAVPDNGAETTESSQFSMQNVQEEQPDKVVPKDVSREAVLNEPVLHTETTTSNAVNETAQSTISTAETMPGDQKETGANPVK
ncbi:MAG: preprotein translocase subunit SecG [Candidatus Brocadiaceae bacterium]|nr:preprotein translocase subunit SecG [Candidatus Brocadiaceae bacterium]